MRQAASLSFGVAIAPEVLVSDDLAAGRLTVPLGDTPSGLDSISTVSKAFDDLMHLPFLYAKEHSEPSYFPLSSGCPD